MKKNNFRPHRLALCFALLVIVFPGYSQKVLFEGDIECKKGTEVFPLVDESGQQTFLLLKDSRSLRCYRFDNDFRLVSSLEGEIPMEISTAKLLGHTKLSDGVINLFFGSSYSDDHDIAIITLDYVNNKVTNQIIKLPLKGELMVGSVGHENKFYIFSTARSSSTLKMYVFSGTSKKYETSIFDFNDESFGPYSQKLSAVLRKSKLKPVENNILTSLQLASSKNKLYKYNNKIVITLDNQESRTELITIDLNSLEGRLAFYPQGAPRCGGTATANSFLSGDFLYQSIFCAGGMVFRIVNLQSGETVKEFNVTKDEEIDFKNTTYLQLGTAYGGDEKELSRANQFLRKVASSNSLVFVYQIAEGIVVTLGGFEEIMTGIPTAMPIGAPTILIADTHSRSVFIKTLLNETTFDHIKGAKIPENALDLVDSYKKGLGSEAETFFGSIIGETAFQYENISALGYYHRKDKKYVLLGF